jgi:alcohol dehydrogenase, propanol-preferring
MLGASNYINSQTTPNYSIELMKTGGVDKAFVFAPSSKAASEAIRATKPGGTIIMGVFAGIDEFPFPDEKIIIGSVIGSREPMREVLKIAASGRIKMPIETDKLDTANETLKALKDGEVETRAVLIP